MFKLQSKLKFIKLKIKEWNTTEFGNIFKDKHNIEDQLSEIHKDWASGINKENSIEQERILMQKWHLRSQQEELLWKEKSRIQWLKEGERNTKFFHRSTMDYRGENKILKLTNAAGEVTKNHNEISSLLTTHFKKIA